MGRTNGIERLWAEAGFRPNAQQRDAILHGDGPLYLPAGPGSGKTRVLLWRVLNLLVFRGIQPEEVFLATFTEKAALQLVEGLRSLLGQVTSRTGAPYDLSKMYVGTVHSLCRRMLNDRRFVPGRQRASAPVLLDELSQHLFLRRRRHWSELLEAAGIRHDPNREINRYFSDRHPSGSRHVAIGNLIGLFNRLAEENIAPREALKRDRGGALRPLLKMYERYRELLADGGEVPYVDFPLIQQKACELVAAGSGADSGFKHVIIDEYQDTNPIQELLFFRLAAGHKNLCVVGDDDQALYRFRGATVENFVEFPERVRRRLGVEPRRITLATNYRSRARIVGFYTQFMAHPACDWRRKGGGHYRVVDKHIRAESADRGVAVVASTPAAPEEVSSEIARLVRTLIEKKKVEDPNQIAFLYPSLKSTQVGRMIEALEAEGLKVYAPRAGTFLGVEESVAMLGLFFRIFGKPARGDFPGQDYQAFHDWVDEASARAGELCRQDGLLDRYVDERQAEAKARARDCHRLVQAAERRGWELDGVYRPETMRDALSGTPGLSQAAVRSLRSPYFDGIARRRLRDADRPFTLRYVINRASSTDWNLLDLFYQLCGFTHFRATFDLAEKGEDEGPICNLGLVSQYLARFMDEFSPVLTGDFLKDGRFLNLFSNYLYVLFRRGESEYEDAEDPFPKGRIPFITIHQAKGLEFPVVVLGNPRKNDRTPQRIEEMVRPLIGRKGEPLERMPQFDVRRMFYVALSRAKNLLVIAHFKGQGQSVNEPFASMMTDDFPRIPDLDVASVPAARLETDEMPKTYSFTGDYLLYRKCPRQYMVFRRYGFAPSRSQTVFFGNLVHRTLDDLHNALIARRTAP